MRPNYPFHSPHHIPKRETRPFEVPRSPDLRPQGQYHMNSMHIHSNSQMNVPYSSQAPEMPKNKPSFLDKKGSPNAQKTLPLPSKNQSTKNHTETSSQSTSQDFASNLRTTCPNVFSKVDFASLRNTTHGKGLAKYAVIDEGKRSDIVPESHHWEMNKKGVDLHYSSTIPSNPEMKKPPIFQKNPPKQMGHTLLKSCGPKTLTQIWKKNKQSQLGKDSKKKLSNSCEIDNKKSEEICGFRIVKELGMGKFGEVYLAQHESSGFLVALKKIVKKKIEEYKMTEQLKDEIRLHNSLDHPNIVKFYGFFEDNDIVYLILEYIPGGTLFDKLTECDRLSVKQSAHYIKSTLEAIGYMHDRSIAHRDIKPQNIVLATTNVCKLCDFGWSALVESSRKTYCGTFDYVPPEVLEQKNYDTSVDIWCIGILTFQLLTGRVPFEGEQKKEIMKKIINVDENRLHYPCEIDEDAKNFIEMIVQKDPKQRPKCKELLTHPFITINTKQVKK